MPVETVSIHPDRPLYEACRKLLSSRARRIPLVDLDDEHLRPMVVSVITQYRILKFIAAERTNRSRHPYKACGSRRIKVLLERVNRNRLGRVAME